MDERLPLGSPDAATLAMLLEKERDERRGLEQERSRLQAGLARQNERLIALERQVSALVERLAVLEQENAGLREQNGLVRQRVAALEIENTRLRDEPPSPVHQPDPWPSTPTKGGRRRDHGSGETGSTTAAGSGQPRWTRRSTMPSTTVPAVGVRWPGAGCIGRCR